MFDIATNYIIQYHITDESDEHEWITSKILSEKGCRKTGYVHYLQKLETQQYNTYRKVQKNGRIHTKFRIVIKEGKMHKGPSNVFLDPSLLTTENGLENSNNKKPKNYLLIQIKDGSVRGKTGLLPKPHITWKYN